MPVESFNDRAITDGAPARTGSLGVTPAVEVPLTSATGTPALAVRASGTENLGADYKTFEAGDSRPQASFGNGPKPPQKFGDGTSV